MAVIITDLVGLHDLFEGQEQGQIMDATCGCQIQVFFMPAGLRLFVSWVESREPSFHLLVAFLPRF